ncbi:Separase [Vitis vinifera]|uniref:Separase n=1 Tax=Vitis vinifera TaxID=29760 RepID=A0A438IGY9_VITVI|nr:Separase [Vitis vinifera]
MLITVSAIEDSVLTTISLFEPLIVDSCLNGANGVNHGFRFVVGMGEMEFIRCNHSMYSNATTSFSILEASGSMSAARVVYVLSRDGRIPFSSIWQKVHLKQKVPSNAMWLCAVICILLGFSILKVNVVFTAITSICTIGWVGGYAVPIFARMVMVEKNFKLGPFYLGKTRKPICLEMVQRSKHRGHEIQKLENRVATLLMGCSSGSLSLNGQYTLQGTHLSYLSVGSPVIVVNLWEVTDKDIDRFGKAMLVAWLRERSSPSVVCAQCRLVAGIEVHEHNWC